MPNPSFSIRIGRISSSQFKTFTTIIADADLNGNAKPKAMTEIFSRTRNQITESNIVPIGIINADATFLTQEQIDENIKAKSEGQKINNDSYENIEIIMAGLLQAEIFQGDISFQISPDLVQSNLDNPIETIEIDFQDGKEWQRFEMKEQLISHQFNTVGTVAIAIKIVTKRGTYLTYCPLKINLLERPKVFALIPLMGF